MPKASPIQTSFSAGEISPLLYGRVDNERYKTGLATCLNYLPTIQGPIIRRPGTKFVNYVKDSTKPPAFIPFQFSLSQNYVLEFGDQYIRFYANNGQVVTTGSTNFKVSGVDSYTGLFSFYGARTSYSPLNGEFISASSSVAAGVALELQTPYSYADVAAIKFAQDADTLYLAHSSYPTYKLQRSAQTTWALREVNFKDGPYLAYNSYLTTGDSADVVFSISATGSIISLTTAPTRTITGAASNGAGLIRITSNAHGFLDGDSVVISGVGGTTEANNTILGTLFQQQWVVRVPSVNTFDLVGSVFVNAYIAGGIANKALFAPSTNLFVDTDVKRAVAVIQNGVRYWGNIKTVLSAAAVNFVGSRFNPPNPVVTGSIAFWQLGTWSAGNQYPSTVCFHQDRLSFAGSPTFPQEIDMSQSADYENFAPSSSSLVVSDNCALQFTLNASERNSINWLKSNAQGLLAGSQNAEWHISPSSASQALTPTNFNAAQTSFFGSAEDVDAVQASNATLYVQRAQRKVREMNYFFQVGTFRSTDLTELSEHITLPQVTKLVVQKETQPVVWAMRSDGNLVSMTYNRDDLTLKVGWAQHLFGGQSDSGGTNPVVKTMAVIPDPTGTFDQLWMAVQRYINGSSSVCVEYMTKIFNDGMAQEDAFQLDCGGTYDSPLVPVSSGITNNNPSVVQITAHGLLDNDVVKITDVVGLNLSTTDINGNVTRTNLVNGKTFVVAVVNANFFALKDFSGNNIDGSLYSPFVSGGKVRKLVTHITGLGWLNNETVSVLADGGIHPNVVVQSSAITLSYPAAKVQIGYGYNSDGVTLRSEAGAADGSSIGKLRRISRAAFMLHNVGDFSMGPTLTNLLPFQFAQADQQQADVATPLWSGIYRDGIEDIYDFDDMLAFRQNSPLPGVVQSITIMMDEFDV